MCLYSEFWQSNWMALQCTIHLLFCSYLCPGLRSRSRKESYVFGWSPSQSRIPNKTRSWSRIFLSDFDSRCPIWIIFYVILLSGEFLLKWYNFFWNVCWNIDFLLCTTSSIDFNSQTSFPLIMLRSRSYSRIFYLRLRNPASGLFVYFASLKTVQ